MIREEEGGLRIVNLDLRCIEVLCGCTTKAFPQFVLKWSLSVLSFLECSAAFDLVEDSLFLQISIFLAQESSSSSRVLTFSPQFFSSLPLLIGVPENSTSTYYSTLCSGHP